MSTEAVTAAAVPPGELAIAQRVRQLQTLIEQARQVSVSGVIGGTSAGATPQASAGDFAAALQSATTAGSTTAGSMTTGSMTTGSMTTGSMTTGSMTTGSMTTGSMPAAYQGESTAPAGEGSSAYDPLIEQAAARYGIDPAVLHGLIQQESGFNPSAQSSAGAAGLTQLMPGTAASLGVANPLDPVESIEGGARYLSQLSVQFGGNTTDALAAYNAGPGAVQQYGGVPPYAETQSYVSKVLGYAEAYSQAHALPNATGGLA